MPKYAYRCSFCQAEWTSWASISLPIPTECPECIPGTPYRVPPDSLSIVREATQEVNHKTGNLVEQAIIEAKEDFKKQVESLRGESDDYI